MHESFSEADSEFLERFQLSAIPPPEWTHRAHVRIAYLHLEQFGLDGALERVRTGIQKLNAANGVEEGPTMGYNETTTVSFLRIVWATMRSYGTVFPVSTSDEFCDTHPQLMSPKILRLYYSPERRSHPDAKTSFIEPDLAPLPEPG